MIFAEHGVFEVKVDGKLLLVDATGPFNEELIKRYQRSLDTCIEHLKASEWHQIVTFHQMSIFTPEAEEALTQSLINRHSRGLVACGVVIADVDCKSLVQEQMSRCYNKAEVKHQYFSSMAKAKEWVNQLP